METSENLTVIITVRVVSVGHYKILALITWGKGNFTVFED